MLLESGRLLTGCCATRSTWRAGIQGRFDLRLCNTEPRSTMKSVLAGVATQAAGAAA